jgi:hypothetical protein
MFFKFKRRWLFRFMTTSHIPHTVIHCVLGPSRTDVVCLIFNQLTLTAIDCHIEVVFLTICYVKASKIYTVCLKDSQFGEKSAVKHINGQFFFSVCSYNFTSNVVAVVMIELPSINIVLICPIL